MYPGLHVPLVDRRDVRDRAGDRAPRSTRCKCGPSKCNEWWAVVSVTRTKWPSKVRASN